MRLPIGIQDFTNLRENNYLYVDKTMYFQSFMEGGRYFLSRPRRFGKSLLLSTLKAAFASRKDLFNGLWLEHNHNFAVRPVIRLDFSKLDYHERSLEISLLEDFRLTAFEHNLQLEQNTAKAAFEELIRLLSSRGRVVVLIDEYDKPITDYLLEPNERNKHQEVLKSVYGVLKPMDEYLHLVLLTGVSKVGKLSLFSDLNNLQDISLNNTYATMCGYTLEEINQYFLPRLENIAIFQKRSLTEVQALIRLWYNGYSWDGTTRVYCPFSFLLFLEQQQFKSFWFETGTPTFLVQLIRAAQINPFIFEQLLQSEQSLSVLDVDKLDPIGLMFQTGYLTITHVESDGMGTRYTLSYPNEEVRQAFSSGLLAEYSQSVPSFIGGFSLELQRALANLDWDLFFATVNRVLAGIPYEIFPRREDYIHSLVHLMLIGTGYKTQSQVQSDPSPSGASLGSRTATGRIDTLLETLTHSIIFEFKIKGTAKNALKQIEAVGYADSFDQPVVKVGVRFDLEKKLITQWAIAG